LTKTIGFLAALLAFGAVPVHAQICAGRTAFNLAPTNVGFDAGANGSGHGVGVSVGHGRDALFGVVSAATHTVAGAARVYSVGVTLATDQPLSPDNKFHVCPMITLGYVSDANEAAGDGGRFGVSAAGDASLLAINTPGLRVVPTISIDLRFNGAGRTTGLFAQRAGRNDNTFSAGLGFVIWNRLSVVPRLVVPFRSLSQSGAQVTVGYNSLRR
jgi:hypothetical protein